MLANMRHSIWGNIFNNIKVGSTSTRLRIETSVGARYGHQADCTKEDPYKKTCKKVATSVEDLPDDKFTRDKDCKLLIEEKRSTEEKKPDGLGAPPENPPKVEKEDNELVVASDGDKVQVVPGSKTEEDYSDNPRVVIVGAGMAGMAAANRLTSMGLCNVVVLEATERYGGRILTKYWRGSVIDLGGVLNEDDSDDPVEEDNKDFLSNPLIYHADRLGLIKFKKNLSMARTMLTENDGTDLPLAPTFLALSKMQRIVEVAESMKISCPYTDQGRTAEYIGLRMQQEMRAMPSDTRAVSARVFVTLALLAADLKIMSDDGAGPFMSIPGSGIKLPVGTGASVATLASPLADIIKFNKVVNRICWGVSNHGPRAVVRTKDGSEYTADYVVFTPSLGYLQAHHDQLFCPTLPYVTVRTLEEALFDHVTKVYLHYETPMNCWRESKIAVKLPQNAADLLPPPIRGLRELKEVNSSENIISAVLRGAHAPVAETAPATELMDTLHMFIKQIVGKDNLEPPNDMIRSSWASNEFHAGSRAPCDNKALRSPLPSSGSADPPVIYFAGDAVSSVRPGTIVAAFGSGMSVADKILSYLPGKRDTFNATEPALQLKAAVF